MKTFTNIFLPFIIITFLTLSACDELDDHYATNPAYRLSFSTDTLAFDTVFSTVGSTTKQLMIYNKNDEPLNIESILLASGETTGFRINVDGRKGSTFNNVSILEQDSMYVFVEVTVNPNNGNQPLLVQDSILFQVNGNRQSVLLEAYGQDVHLYKGGKTFDRDTTLPANKPYLIYDSLTVSKGAKVTIAPGATFYMHNKANWIIHGAIEAVGTVEQPILFRGDRLDDILENTLSYDNTPGQWGGIFIKSDSYENRLESVIIRSGTSGLTCELSTPDQPKLTILNSRITNMSENLLSAINCDITAVNSEFTNAGGSVMTLIGGQYEFTHCTIANYMSLTQRDGGSETTLPSKTLYLLNNATVNKSGPYPITKAHFYNCIIDGSFTATDNFQNNGEISISSGEELTRANETEDFDYLFDHCLLKALPMENSHCIDVIFGKQNQDNFMILGGEENHYKYDFRLAADTVPAVGAANKAISEKYPTDFYGINRIESPNGPSIGAYEYVPLEEEETTN